MTGVESGLDLAIHAAKYYAAAAAVITVLAIFGAVWLRRQERVR